MAEDQEDLPRRKRVQLERPSLDAMGIAELEGYILELRGEITRVETDISRKQGHRSAADSFFRAKPGP